MPLNHQSANIRHHAYVISSRIRLARNLQNYRLPYMACSDEREAVAVRVRKAASGLKWFLRTTCVDIDALHPLDRRLLEEKRLISPAFIRQGSHRFAMIANSSKFSILVNEEDHLRIQAMRPGLHLSRAWKTARYLEQSLQEILDFAGQHVACFDQGTLLAYQLARMSLSPARVPADFPDFTTVVRLLDSIALGSLLPERRRMSRQVLNFARFLFSLA